MPAMGRKVGVIASNTKYEIARKLQLERGIVTKPCGKYYGRLANRGLSKVQSLAMHARANAGQRRCRRIAVPRCLLTRVYEWSI